MFRRMIEVSSCLSFTTPFSLGRLALKSRDMDRGVGEVVRNSWDLVC